MSLEVANYYVCYEHYHKRCENYFFQERINSYPGVLALIKSGIENTKSVNDESWPEERKVTKARKEGPEYSWHDLILHQLTKTWQHHRPDGGNGIINFMVHRV